MSKIDTPELSIYDIEEELCRAERLCEFGTYFYGHGNGIEIKGEAVAEFAHAVQVHVTKAKEALYAHLKTRQIQ